jgi:hypothetical protein
MRILIVAVALSLAAGVTGTSAQVDEAPMTLFLTAAQPEERKELDKAAEKAMKDERKEAEKARKDLEKQLKQQHGKDKDKWPEEAQEQYYLAEEVQAVADANYEYRKSDPEGVTDALEDLRESIRGEGVAGVKERVVLVDTPQEAQLVVEVRARRSTKNFGAVVPSNCYTLFAVGPGELLDAARFEEVPTNYRPRKFGLAVWRISAPKPEDPTFVFESYNGYGRTAFGCHGSAANAAAAGIEKFVEDNHAILTAAAD